jgi:multidrug transporter EmrE-like cation transporter
MKHALPILLTCNGVILTLVGDVFIKRSGIWAHPKFLIIGAAFYLGGCIPVALLFRELDFSWVFILWESITVVLAVVVGRILFGESFSVSKLCAVAIAGMAALILGQKRTADMANETGPDPVKTKAEIMEYVKGSFMALHKAVATIDEKNVVQPTTSPSPWQKTRLSFAMDAVAHSFNHYGQLVEYLRMNSVVPPDSRPQKR